MTDTFPTRYCSLCRYEIVVCPKCGNNTCNGGYGTIDGQECDVCPDAYRAANLLSPELPEGYFIIDGEKEPHDADVSDGRYCLYYAGPWSMGEDYCPEPIVNLDDREALIQIAKEHHAEHGEMEDESDA